MRNLRFLPAVGCAVLLLILWEAAVVLGDIPSIILPPVSSVLAVMVAKAPLYLTHSLATLAEVMIGFIAATLAGVLLGTLIASSALLGNALYPMLIATQVMPKVAIAPILIIWFGFGIMPKVVLTALIAFFPVVINTIVGLNATSRENMYLFRSMGASGLQTFFRLRLPGALPVFFGGVKIASTLAVIGAVVGEFAGADEGLGYLLMVQVGLSETAAAFGSVLYLTLLGLIVFGIVAVIERLVMPSHMLKRMSDIAV